MSAAYTEVLDQVHELTPQDQLRLLEDLAALVRRQMIAHPRRSIMELQGLGKEIWNNIDAQTYVDRERESWSG
jgi:hypothetical protein